MIDNVLNNQIHCLFNITHSLSIQKKIEQADRREVMTGRALKDKKIKITTGKRKADFN